MKIKAAVFDVDGTLINGHCTGIFFDYLLKNKLIDFADLEDFNQSFRRHALFNIHFAEVFQESLKILSRLDLNELREQWQRCFLENVRPQINPECIGHLKKFQSEQVKVILASGSHFELIRPIAREIGLEETNILATRTKILDGRLTKEISGLICYGAGKEKQLMEFLQQENISLDNTCFFTDNPSDLPLLKKVFTGYWLGSQEMYAQEKLSDWNIIPLIHQEGKAVDSGPAVPVMGSSLEQYYESRKTLISNAVYQIIPPQCTAEALKRITGRDELPWDLETMQEVFFTPLFQYIDQQQHFTHTLGTCLFFDASGLDPYRFQSLIGIFDLLNISQKIFSDVTRWTIPGYSQPDHKSHIDISILGNISIALLSLVTNNLLFDRLKIDEEKQLQLLQSFTDQVFKALFGNGLLQFEATENGKALQAAEYQQVAIWTNPIPCRLLLTLSPGILEKEQTSQALINFSNDASFTIQIRKDLHVIEQWQNRQISTLSGSTDLSANYLWIIIREQLKESKSFPGKYSDQEIRQIMVQTKCLEQLKERLRIAQERTESRLKGLPFTEHYKGLIRDYLKILPYA